jgi:chromosome segregation ATPase
MNENTVPIILSIIALLSSLGAPLIGYLFNRSKTKAEARKTDEEAVKIDADASVAYMSAARASAEILKEEQNINRDIREALRSALNQVDALNKDVVNRNVVIMEHEKRFAAYDQQLDLVRGQLLNLQQEKHALEERVRRLESEKAILESDNERMRFQMSETAAEVVRYRLRVEELESKQNSLSQ